AFVADGAQPPDLRSRRTSARDEFQPGSGRSSPPILALPAGDGCLRNRMPAGRHLGHTKRSGHQLRDAPKIRRVCQCDLPAIKVILESDTGSSTEFRTYGLRAESKKLVQFCINGRSKGTMK